MAGATEVVEEGATAVEATAVEVRLRQRRAQLERKAATVWLAAEKRGKNNGSRVVRLQQKRTAAAWAIGDSSEGCGGKRRLKEKQERRERLLLAALCSEKSLLATLCSARSLLAATKADAAGCERSLLAATKAGDSER
ncbi:hypothetical protein BHE74_00024879 [Ensete ventricosum]|nr:hypothetical protein BHE74_00024879 [Ensete ventricosum]